MNLNRLTPPEFKTIDKVDILKANKIALPNKINTYEINAGSQDLIKLELMFSAGSRFQEKPLLAYAANTLIMEGTEKYTSEQIANITDYYGAFLQTEIDKDYAGVTLYTLNKHLDHVLPLLKSVVTEAVFPIEEIETFIQNEKQRFLVDEKKVSVIARKHFNEMIFGSAHAYGYNLKIEDFDNLTREAIQGFYNQYYHAGNCTIIVAGKISEKENKKIASYFGENFIVKPIPAYSPKTIQSSNENKKVLFREDAVQSAIRIGRLLFNKNHPDYFGMQVLNTILGGYFGSRLMANIREDKGYTYGIGSGLLSMKEAGAFFISTEVGVEVCKEAIHEIYLEIKRLREELISEEELQLVKNYMMGVFLKNVDGPFALSDRLKSLLEYDFGYEFFDQYIETIKTITAFQIKELANKYLKEEDLLELVVGKK